MNNNIYLNPEDLAYWYFRLNGFFTIPNFIIHQDIGIGQRTDVDMFGVRFPHRAELLENPMDDEDLFTKYPKPYIVIVEVKKDRCSLNGPWTDPKKENMHRVLHALGAFYPGYIDNIANQLYEHGFYEGEFYIMSLVCVGKRTNPEYLRRYPKVPQITWENIARFIFNRFSKYYEQKSINRQWDKSGIYLWNRFKQCRNKQDGQRAYIETIIRSLTQEKDICDNKRRLEEKA